MQDNVINDSCDAIKSRNYDTALKEYFWIEDQIDRFDERSLKIKAWSVTVSVAAIGAAISYKQPLLFLLASLSALVFWYLEAIWKYFQEALGARVAYLEAFLNGNEVSYTGPGINQAFQHHFTWSVEKTKFPRIFRLRNVNLPHSIVVISGIALYVLAHYGLLDQLKP